MAKQHRVVLVFGEPGSGKSYLADRLRDEYGYSAISLDNAYLDFIKEKHQNLYLPDLAVVISQHYETILDSRGKKAWEKYAVSFIKAHVKKEELTVVEGYLLSPILDTVRSKISGMAEIALVEVIGGEYFVLSDIDWIVE